MVRDGFLYALGLGVVAVLLSLTGWPWLAVIPVLLAVFFLWFFRDPSRTIPQGRGVIVSPADGKITEAEWIETGAGTRLRISVFLSVFDVHVNRAPIEGRVTQVDHRAGLFKNALSPDSSLVNEQTLVVVENPNYQVSFKLIAGLLARRIVCNLKVGDKVERGQRIGLIKFGSRVDVLLPSDAVLKVKKGSRVKGGSTILAEMPVASEA